MVRKRRRSTWIIIAIIAVVSALFIWSNNPLSQLPTYESKLKASLTVVAVCIPILFLDDIFVRVWQWFVSLSFVQSFWDKTGKKTEKVNKNESVNSTTIKEIRLYLRNPYGRRWGRKTRILLITSTESEYVGYGQGGILTEAVRKRPYSVALLARFRTVIYRPLSPQAMRTIVEKKLSQVSRRLHRHYGLTTHIDKSMYDALKLEGSEVEGIVLEFAWNNHHE